MMETPETKRSARPEIVKWSGYAALFLAVGAAAASVFVDRTWFAFVANGVLVVYLCSVFVLARGNAQVASRMGENVYFLGYLLTITGLGLLAYEIGKDPTMLDKEKIHEVFIKGGNAVIATLIGLIGMNLIKGYAQSLEQKQEQEADVVERILSKFAERLEQSQVSQGQELIKIVEASQLSRNMQALSSQLDAGSRSIETLKQTSILTIGTLQELASQMTAIHQSSKGFAEVTAAIGPAWQQINANIQAAAGLNGEITALTTGIKHLHENVAAGTTQTKEFVEASKRHHEEIVRTMQTLQLRMQSLTPLTGAVDEFLKTANLVASTLKTIGQDFSEVDNLNQNLAKLVATTGQLNTEFTTGKTAMGQLNDAFTTGEGRLLTINEKSKDLVLAIGDLTAELNTQVHTLTTLAKPFEEFAKLSEQVTPVLNQTGANVKHLTDFTKSIADLQESVVKLKDSFKDGKTEMDGISKVLDNFVRMMETTIRSKHGR
jgi:ABC-type transporter Mla subunit MlaD